MVFLKIQRNSFNSKTPHIATNFSFTLVLIAILCLFPAVTIAKSTAPPLVPNSNTNFSMSLSNLLGKLTRPISQGTAEMSIPEGAQRCTVAAGCFWGTEHVYRKQFAGKGLIDARVGYIGGDTSNPSYRSVCSGKSGHAEAAQIIYDPKQVSYRQLIEFFYRMHDPTSLNRQGPDTGPQYRSAIYFHDEEQEKTAKAVTAQANEKWWSKKIVTEIVPAGKWWNAEDYHQEYLDKNPHGYECPTHFIREKLPPLED